MMRAIFAEMLKMRRSLLSWIVPLILLLPPALAGFIVWTVQDFSRAESLGMTEAVAAELGTPGWDLMFVTATDLFGTGLGSILFAIMAASMFVREYQSGTMKVMLTLPLSRGSLVAAKLAVLGGWAALLTAWVVVLTLCAGALIGLGMPSTVELTAGITTFARIGLLMYLSLSPICLLATSGHGYLPPIGFASLMFILAAGAWATPWARWIPWVMAPVEAAALAGHTVPLGPAEWTWAVAVFVAGAVGTWARMRFTDAPR